MKKAVSSLDGKTLTRRSFSALLSASTIPLAFPNLAFADETCQSPYMPKITGHEEYVYVWTLGVEKMGDGQDKLVTIDLRPNSSTRGKVINSLSVGGRNEAHHGGFTSDRRYLWCGGLGAVFLYLTSILTPLNLGYIKLLIAL